MHRRVRRRLAPWTALLLIALGSPAEAREVDLYARSFAGSSVWQNESFARGDPGCDPPCGCWNTDSATNSDSSSNDFLVATDLQPFAKQPTERIVRVRMNVLCRYDNHATRTGEVVMRLEIPSIGYSENFRSSSFTSVASECRYRMGTTADITAVVPEWTEALINDVRLSVRPARATNTTTLYVNALRLRVDTEDCTYGVSPTDVRLDASAQNFGVNVTTEAGCGWSVSENVAWISVVAGAAGVGSNVPVFRAEANTAGTSRSATITVAGRSVTVTQAGSPCDVSLSATTVSAPGDSHSTRTVDITVPSGCPWTATADGDGAWWITLNPLSGTGSGRLTLSIFENECTTPRSATVTVRGANSRTITVNQSGRACFLDVPSTRSVGGEGGTVSVFVDTPCDCDWAASLPETTWISMSSTTATRTGPGVVQFEVAENRSPATRSVDATIGGRRVAIVQRPGSDGCDTRCGGPPRTRFPLLPGEITVEASGSDEGGDTVWYRFFAEGTYVLHLDERGRPLERQRDECEIVALPWSTEPRGTFHLPPGDWAFRVTVDDRRGDCDVECDRLTRCTDLGDCPEQLDATCGPTADCVPPLIAIVQTAGLGGFSASTSDLATPESTSFESLSAVSGSSAGLESLNDGDASGGGYRPAEGRVRLRLNLDAQTGGSPAGYDIESVRFITSLAGGDCQSCDHGVSILASFASAPDDFVVVGSTEDLPFAQSCETAIESTWTPEPAEALLEGVAALEFAFYDEFCSTFATIEEIDVAGSPASSSAEVFVRGDSNADGALDLSDAAFTLAHLFTGGASPSCPDAADTNDDGEVDISDALYALAFLFLGGAPPSPFPACGPDETEDTLGPCEYAEESCR